MHFAPFPLYVCHCNCRCYSALAIAANSVFNTSLYDFVTPQSAFTWQRNAIANAYAIDGEDWTVGLFSLYNVSVALALALAAGACARRLTRRQHVKAAIPSSPCSRFSLASDASVRRLMLASCASFLPSFSILAALAVWHVPEPVAGGGQAALCARHAAGRRLPVDC